MGEWTQCDWCQGTGFLPPSYCKEGCPKCKRKGVVEKHRVLSAKRKLENLCKALTEDD